MRLWVTDANEGGSQLVAAYREVAGFGHFLVVIAIAMSKAGKRRGPYRSEAEALLHADAGQEIRVQTRISAILGAVCLNANHNQTRTTCVL